MTQMKNIILHYSNAPSELKSEINTVFQNTDPDLISFPHKGKLMQGFIYEWKAQKYLIILSEVGTEPVLDLDDDIDDIDDDFVAGTDADFLVDDEDDDEDIEQIPDTEADEDDDEED